MTDYIVYFVAFDDNILRNILYNLIYKWLKFAISYCVRINGDVNEIKLNYCSPLLEVFFINIHTALNYRPTVWHVSSSPFGWILQTVMSSQFALVPATGSREPTVHMMSQADWKTSDLEGRQRREPWPRLWYSDVNHDACCDIGLVLRLFAAIPYLKVEGIYKMQNIEI